MSNKNKLYGAILGDLAGQPYEFKYKGDFSEFNIHDERSHITDDTILTLATAYALINNTSFEAVYRMFGVYYQGDYFGKRFNEWLKTEYGTKNDSWGNGCLMRISPIMYLSNKQNQLELVIDSCLTSHASSKSILACIGLFELYDEADEIKSLWRTNAKIQPFEKFEVSAEKTLEFVQHAYLLADDNIPKSTVDRIERVVKCGGDADTNASIIGELMNYTFNDLTEEDCEYVESKLDSFLLDVLKEFNDKYKD